MEAAGLSAEPPRRSAGRRLADLFHGRPRLQVGALLAGPVGWLVIAYLGSLAILFVAAFWHLDELSGEIERGFSLDNFETLIDRARLPRDHGSRTIGVAALVTVTDALLAFPIAFYMAKVATPADALAAGRGGADAAVVELPGQGLRLAHDPERGGGAQLGCSTRSG